MLKLFFALIVIFISNITVFLPNCHAAEKLVVSLQSKKYASDEFRQIASKYARERNFDYRVELAIPIEKQIPVMMSKASSPDIIIGVPHEMLPLLKSYDAIEKLDDFLTEEEKKQYTELTIEAMTIDNRLYGIPISLETQVLVYNKDLVRDPPKTWEELKEKAISLRQTGIEGCIFNAENLISVWPFFSAFGMETAHLDRRENSIQNPAMINGAEFIKDLGKNGIVDFKYANYKSLKRLFSEGKAGMIIDGSWSLRYYKKKGIPFGVAAIPPIRGDKILRPLVYVDGIVINKFSKNKNLAIEFSKYLTRPENLEKIWVQNYWAIPNVQLIQKLTEINKNIPAVIVFNQTQAGVLFPKTPRIKAILEPTNRALTEIFLYNKNPEASLRKAQMAISEMERK